MTEPKELNECMNVPNRNPMIKSLRALTIEKLGAGSRSISIRAWIHHHLLNLIRQKDPSIASFSLYASISKFESEIVHNIEIVNFTFMCIPYPLESRVNYNKL